MTVSILQSNYIPWKGYFDIIAKSDVFIIYDEVQYTRRDWRNRNLIKTSNGLDWLTIPVRQEDFNQKICDTKTISNSWQRKHIGSIQNNYSKADNFKNYKDQVFDLYTSKSDFLSDINLSFIKGICKMLHIETDIIDSRELNLEGNKSERLVDACKKLNADRYLSGPAAKDYLETDLFQEENINVEWMNYSNYEKYHQLYPPFTHNVSVLDLIFNMGEESMFFLKKLSRI